MTSKAEARRNKKAKQAFPALSPIERKSQHRVGGKFAKDDDPRKTALQARERQLGKCDYPKGDKSTLSPYLGHAIGYVIQSECAPDEAAKLWDVWQAYSAAERGYRVRYLGQTGEPKGASVMAVPEPMQVDLSMRVDMRTDQERDAQAVSTWTRWQGNLGMIPKDGMSALRQAERGNGRVLWADGKATDAGMFALEMLRALAAVVCGGR